MMAAWSGNWLVTTEYQNPNTIKVWDFATRQFKFNLATLQKSAMWPCFSPDGALFAVGCEDRNVYIWQTSAWAKQVAPSKPSAILTNEFEPTGVRFSPDGKILALSGVVLSPVEPSHARNRLAFWQVGTWTKLDLLPRAGEVKSEESAGVTQVFSEDGHTLSIGHKDGSVQLWDFKRNELLSEFKDHDAGLGYSVGTFFSKDGHLLLTSSMDDSKVVLHDIHDPRQPVKVASWTCNHIGRMWEAIFDPDNRTVVSSGNDGRIKFWNLLTHHAALTLKHGEGPGGVFGFTSDGSLMVSLDAHGTLKFWPATPAAEIPKTKTIRAGVTQ
jgi:WD40 repeat protein